MLICRNIFKTYKLSKNQSIKAVNDISLALNDKGLVFILGKSGSGKSTLLNLLSGIDRPDKGEIIFNDLILNTEETLNNYRKNDIGFVFQEYNLLKEFNVSDNITLANNLDKKTNKQLVSEILKKVNLEGYEKRRISELSGGEKQRVAIARALIRNPKVIFADEPSGALDRKNGKEIFQYLKELSQDRLIVIVSHDEEYANLYGDRIIKIEDGKIISDSNPLNIENIFNKSKKDSSSATFLNRIKGNLKSKEIFKISYSLFKMKPFRLLITILLTCFSLISFGVSFSMSIFNIGEVASREIDAQDYNYFHLGKMENGENPRGFISLFDIEDINKIKSEYNLNLNVIIPHSKVSNTLDFNNVYYKDLDNSSFYYSRDPLYGMVYLEENKLIDNLNYSLIGNFPTMKNEILLTDFQLDYLNYYGMILFSDNNLEILNPYEITPIKLINKYINLGGEFYKISGILDSDINFDSLDFKFNSLKNIKETDIKNDEDYLNLQNEILFFNEEYILGFPSCIFISKVFYDELISNNYLILSTLSNEMINIKYNFNDVNESARSISINNSINKNIFFNKDKKDILENEIILSSSSLAEILKVNLKDEIRENNIILENEDKIYYLYELVSDKNGIYSVNKIEKELLENQTIDAFYNYNELVYEYSLSSYPKENEVFNNLVDEFYNDYQYEITDDLKGYLYYLIITMNDEFILNYKDKLSDTLINELNILFNKTNNIEYKNIFGGYNLSYFEDLNLINKYIKYFNVNEGKYIETSLNGRKIDTIDYSFNDKQKVVGYYINDTGFNNIITSEKFYNYIKSNYYYGNYLEGLISFNNINENGYYKFFNDCYDDEIISSPYSEYYYLNQNIRSSLNNIKDLFDMLFLVLLGIAIGLALFSILLFFNFMLTTISLKMKEIGVILSLGAKKIDVFYIFIFECLFIILVNLILSFLGIFIALSILNNFFKGQYLLLSNVLIFDIRSIILIISIPIIAGLLASIYPIFTNLRKNISETINKNII